MDCISCIENKSRGRAQYRKVRSATHRCDQCGRGVCRLHANRDDGRLRCRACAKANRRRLADQLRGLA